MKFLELTYVSNAGEISKNKILFNPLLIGKVMPITLSLPNMGEVECSVIVMQGSTVNVLECPKMIHRLIIDATKAVSNYNLCLTPA